MVAGFAAVVITASLGPHHTTPAQSSKSADYCLTDSPFLFPAGCGSHESGPGKPRIRIASKEGAAVIREIRRLGGCASVSRDPHTHKVTVKACPSN